MNKVLVSGRFYKDPEVRYTDGGSTIARFGIACDRKFKADGQPTADFINCVAFGKIAEFIEKYFHKGSGIELEGRIQTGSYEKDGHKVYTTDVIVEAVEFPKGGSKGENNSDKPAVDDGFVNVPDGLDEELPFN